LEAKITVEMPIAAALPSDDPESEPAKLPQIVAIGGGGFLDGSENLALENFILGLANKPKPN
jgi:hypothetical protein